MQTAKASRKQSSFSGKESAQGCIPQRLLGRPDEALGGGNQGPSAPGWVKGEKRKQSSQLRGNKYLCPIFPSGCEGKPVLRSSHCRAEETSPRRVSGT